MYVARQEGISVRDRFVQSHARFRSFATTFPPEDFFRATGYTFTQLRYSCCRFSVRETGVFRRFSDQRFDGYRILIVNTLTAMLVIGEHLQLECFNILDCKSSMKIES